MAIIRELNNSDNFNSYLATVALFCGISCTILMLKFRGFRASFDLTSGQRISKEYYEETPQESVIGAYRSSRNEYQGDTKYVDHRKIITPSMVKLQLPPTNEVPGIIKPSKSTGDLSKENNGRDIRKSTPNVAVSTPTTVQNTNLNKQQLKEQKKREKERLAEQKKREKLEAKVRAKEEKLRKEREKQQAKEAKAKERQRKTKPVGPPPQQSVVTQQTVPPKLTVVVPQHNAAPKLTAVPPQQTHTKQTRAPPPPQQKTTNQPTQQNTPLPQVPAQYSTNTLESSISRSSGPPPYSDTPKVVVNRNDNTGNTSFVKPVDTSSSWDLVSQHRQQIKKTNASAHTITNSKDFNLQYNVGNIVSGNKDNSDA